MVRRRRGGALDRDAGESRRPTRRRSCRARRQPGSWRRTGSMRARARVWRIRRGGGMWGRCPVPSWSAAGRFGSALSFDGVNDWVTVPDANSLDLSTGMTLEAWVRPSTAGWLADGGVQGAPGWRRVRIVRRSGRRAAVGAGGHRRRAECGRDGGVAAECVVASGDDVSTGRSCVCTSTACWRARLACSGVDGGVDGRCSGSAATASGASGSRADRRGAGLQPRAQRGRDPAGHADGRVESARRRRPTRRLRRRRRA